VTDILIPPDVLALPLDPFELAVYVELRAFARGQEEVSVSIAYLAEARRISSNKVRAALKALAGMGLVRISGGEREDGGSAPFVYAFADTGASRELPPTAMPPSGPEDELAFKTNRELAKNRIWGLTRTGNLTEKEATDAWAELDRARSSADVRRILEAKLRAAGVED